MSNKIKKTMIGVCATLCVGALIGAGSTSAKAENSESAVASFVQSSCYYGSDWEGHYGSKGYVLPSERTNQVYSDMYEGKSGSEYINTTNTALKSDATISSFGVVCNNWVYAMDNTSTKWQSLYKPGADTNTIEDADFVRPRITDSSATIRNISVTFELKAGGYVTAYVYRYNAFITPTQRASVRLYSGTATEHSTTLKTFAELDEKNGGTPIATSDVYFTDTGAADATKQGDITRQGSYVTFKIETAGAYTLTAASAGKEGLIIGGLFFDETNRNPQVSAEYSSTNTEHKLVWEGNYGNDGYIVLAPGESDQKGAFYSNMYGEENVGTKIQGTESNGFVYLSNTKDRYLSDADIQSEVISKWGATSSLWKAGSTDMSLYAPGTTEGVNLRFVDDSKGANGNKYNDTSMFFRTIKAETYVTVYVSDWNKKVSEQNPITVAVMNTAQNFHNGTATELMQWYGVQSALATATVTSQSSYVTFKLKGIGDYQIVAYDANATSETEGVTLPGVTGLFFDSKDRNFGDETETGKTEFYGEDTTTVSDWEGRYGNQGYIIYTLGSDNKTKMAYTKGIYKDADGNDYTGLVTYTSAGDKIATDGIYEFAVDGYNLSDKLVSRYGGRYANWEYKVWLNSTDTPTYVDQKLYHPGTKETTPGMRIGMGAASNHSAVSFTVSKDALKGHSAMLVTVYQDTAFDFQQLGKAVTMPTELYKEYYINLDQGGTAENKIAEHSVQMAGYGGFYVTYAIAEAGDYTLYIKSAKTADGNTVRGSLAGVFFDYPVENEYFIQYELDGGVNAAENPKKYTSGTELTLVAPQKSGYTFVGWF